MPARTWVFFVLLLGVLIAGTLQIGLLTNSYATFTLPGAWASGFQAWLDSVVPPNASLGIEGVSVHGVLLIGLLIVIGVTAWFGLEQRGRGVQRLDLCRAGADHPDVAGGLVQGRGGG